jgi:hypothetical protein
MTCGSEVGHHISSNWISNVQENTLLKRVEDSSRTKEMQVRQDLKARTEEFIEVQLKLETHRKRDKNLGAEVGLFLFWKQSLFADGVEEFDPSLVIFFVYLFTKGYFVSC